MPSSKDVNLNPDSLINLELSIGLLNIPFGLFVKYLILLESIFKDLQINFAILSIESSSAVPTFKISGRLKLSKHHL